jgi:hypothetical protein
MAKPRKTDADSPSIPEAILDRLYGGPADQFVANRDAAAKELRKGGDRAGADAVRSLRRPTGAAAAINRAVREEPAQARALLDAADELRGAHEAVLAGTANRDALKASVAAERQAVGALASTAAGAASRGASPSPELERRIRETLEAVALDPGVRERFAAGRLEQDARASTLAMDVPMPKGGARSRRPPREDALAKRNAERERRKAQEAAERAQELVDRRREEVDEARRRLKDAEAELRRARRAAKEPKTH